jgi:hypothetical protein
MFLFDPTQDPRFRRACEGKTSDPQMLVRSQRTQRESAVRQETILHEAAQRVRRFAGLSMKDKYQRPLVIIVPKFDCWSSLLSEGLPRPWNATASAGLNAMDLEAVDQVSKRVRALLWEVTPEFVSAAEGFAEQVIYIPISATGSSPSVDPATGAVGFRPRDIQPIWVEVPLLYVLARYFEGIIPVARPKTLSLSNGSSARATGDNRVSAINREFRGLNITPPSPQRDRA